MRIYSLMARWLSGGTWILGLLATIGGMFDPSGGPDKAEVLPGVLFLAVEAVIIVRSFRMGLLIDSSHVTSRGILRTRTFPRASITAVRATGYSGLINRGGTSRYFKMLEFRTAGDCVELPHLIGRPEAVRRLASQAQEALARSDGPRLP